MPNEPLVLNADQQNQEEMQMTDTIMPAFVFERRHHVELEAGFTLAGQLIVDIPSGTELQDHHKQAIASIVQQLTAEAQSGRMPDDAMVYGWWGNSRPPNAADTNNDEIMIAWAKRSVAIGVRVSPRSDGMLRVDTDMLRQLDLPEETQH
jgi:hypothetical protein